MLSSKFAEFENVPEIVNKISLVSPFTWLLKIIETGNALVPTIVIILMSAVFFTAGSFKLRDFVKD